METHPKTGAAQLAEVREIVREITILKYVSQVDIQVDQPAAPKPLLFANISDDDLLGYGVPAEWMDDVREADEDSVLELADHLPGEAAEALLELATGGTPQIAQSVTVSADPFEHPDAQRRFRVMSNVEELERALEYPLQERIETVVDGSDLEEVYNTERHLLYVACTRAREYLLVTSGDSPSEFLDDLRM